MMRAFPYTPTSQSLLPPNTPLIQVLDATGNRIKEVQSDQNWAASLQEVYLAQVQLSLQLKLDLSNETVKPLPVFDSLVLAYFKR